MKFILVVLLTVLSKFSCEELFQNRVYNGYKVSSKQIPYLARLTMPRNNQHFICSGSVISHRDVLTAAHCVRKGTESVTVRLGIDNIDQSGFSETCSQCWTVFPTYVYPYDNAYSNKNDLYDILDIALIRLPRYIVFSNRISPIHLPSYTDVGKDLLHKRGTVVGWGETNIFRGKVASTKAPVAAEAVIVDQGRCMFIFYAAKEPFDPRNQFCTMHLDTGSCPGDSGGPFLINNKLFGIVSGGTNKNITTGEELDSCAPNYGDSYTNVAKFKFLRWISENSDVRIGLYRNTLSY